MQFSFDGDNIDFQYNIEGYISIIEISERKRLLVEGIDDKKFFEIFQNKLPLSFKFDIDTAQDINSTPPLGNCQIVEKISQEISNQSYSYKFVGFVDREFRGFDSVTLTDNLRCHKQDRRLIWSRGHSIENYFFDRQMLCEFLRESFTLKCHHESVKLFDNSFSQILFIACAIGLAGDKSGKLRIISETVHSDLFEFQGENLVLKIDEFRERLIVRKKLTDQETSIIIDSYQTYLNKLTVVDLETIQWLCDGHIGLDSIWAAYSCCVLTTTSKIRKNMQRQLKDIEDRIQNIQDGEEENLKFKKTLEKLKEDIKINDPKKQAEKIFDIPKNNRFQGLTYCLLIKVNSSKCVYPLEVFRLLEEIQT